MKSNFQKIAVLCTCTGLLCSCGQSDNKQEHHKEFIPITILHPTTIEFPRSYVADVQAIPVSYTHLTLPTKLEV